MTRIGVIGTGIFANQKHLPAIAKTEGLEITGCYNRTSSKSEDFAIHAEEAQHGTKVKVYDSIEALIEDPEIDAIDALLPVEQNLQIVQKAVQAGKPISFEKPLAATLEDGAEIVRIAESTELPVMVLENWSFHHATLKLKELLPRIGEVFMFNYQASGPFRLSLYHGTKWRQNPKHAGGFISDGGVHDMAQITDVLGPIGTISAHATQVRPESGCIDTITALLNMSNGRTFGSYSQARYSAASPSIGRFQIFGKNGSLLYEKPAGPSGGRITLHEGKDSESSKETNFDVPGDDLNGVTDEFAHWRDVLENKAKVLVTPRRAYHQYAAIYAAVQSAESGGKLVHVKHLS